jgi:hypothetical protein
MISSTMLKGTVRKYRAEKTIDLTTRICALEGLLQCTSCPISVSRTGFKISEGEHYGIVTMASGMYTSMWFSRTQLFRNG